MSSSSSSSPPRCDTPYLPVCLTPAGPPPGPWSPTATTGHSTATATRAPSRVITTAPRSAQDATRTGDAPPKTPSGLANTGTHTRTDIVVGLLCLLIGGTATWVVGKDRRH